MRLILAALIAFWTPLAQAGEPSFDALSHLLHAYAGPVDNEAAQAIPEGGAPPDSGARLAGIQADLTLMAGGFEAFRHPSHAQRALADLPDYVVPELRPFFKDRDSTLDTVYRTLAVIDYTLAIRFPEPDCAPQARRKALLVSKDGLFADSKGDLSPWLSRLLGPSAEGRAAEEALDRASSEQTASAKDYELLRVKIAKITEALDSDKAVGNKRANLYCMRGAAYETLASAHRAAQAGTIQAARGTGTANRDEIASVLLMAVSESSGNFRAVGAGVMVETSLGPRVLTDVSLISGELQEKDSLRGFTRAKDGSLEKSRVFVVEHADQASRILVGRLEEGEGIPALKIAASPPASRDLVRAIGHTTASGAWTISQGLVTATGEGTFASDAILGPEMLGSPVLNDAGEITGLVVLSPKDGSPSAVTPKYLRTATDERVALAQDSNDLQFIENRQTGSGSLLTAAAPLSGGANSTYIYSKTPYGTVRGRCMNCTDEQGSGAASSQRSAGDNVDEVLSPLLKMLIFKGIPAIFRKIGGLFVTAPRAAADDLSKIKSTSKAPSRNPATVVKKAPAPVKQKEPLKLTGLVLEAAPDRGSPGETVTLTARLALNDPDASRKDIVVTFHAKPETLVRFTGEPQAKTDASGVATMTATLRNDHGVRPVKTGDTKAVRQKSKNAFGALDEESRAMNADPTGIAEPEVEEAKDEPVEFDGTATLGISLAGTAMVLILESELQRSYEIDTSALLAITDNSSFKDVRLPHPSEPAAVQIAPFLQANKERVFISPQALREYLEPIKRSTQEKVPLTKEEIAQRAGILAVNKIIPTASASEETVKKFSSARAAFRSPGDADILASAADHKRILITTEQAHIAKYENSLEAGLPLPEMRFLQFEDNSPPRLRP